MTKLNSVALDFTPSARLLLGLKLAADAFDPKGSDAGRTCIMMSLTAVDDYLMAILGGSEAPLLIPLRQLQYALHDLARGKVMPLLKPKKVTSRPRDSAAIEGFRSFAAVAMDLFVQSGVGRKEAARDVARALSRMGYDNGPGKIITASRVEDWRDRMMKEPPERNMAAARFHRMKGELQERFPADLKAGARFLLDRLPMVASIPKKPR